MVDIAALTSGTPALALIVGFLAGLAMDFEHGMLKLRGFSRWVTAKIPTAPRADRLKQDDVPESPPQSEESDEPTPSEQAKQRNGGA